MLIAQDIFDLKCLIKNITIKLCTRIESGVKQLLAIITSNDEIVLHYTYGELPSVIKRIPWFNDTNKLIQGICFDPSASWLLVVSIDGSLYIIPALSLVDSRQKVDCKWQLNDVTYFARPPQSPDAIPTSIVWWQTLDCNQNALVGYENGAIASFSLTDGRCLGCCTISESIKHMYLCQDNSLETVSLLINASSGQQWRLILEQHSVGCLWPPENNTPSDDSNRSSRLSSLKQLGADKLASLKQKLSEARGVVRRDSDTNSDPDSYHSIPELLPCLCDTLFAPQYAKSRYLFSAFYKPTSLLTVHSVDIESAPLYVYKLMKSTNDLLLTDKLIFTINSDNNTLSIISSQLSECRLEGESEFNQESLIAQFHLENESIQYIYKLSDLSTVKIRKNRDENKKIFELPKTIDDLNIKKPRIDTVVIVTNNAVYKVVVRCSPVKQFVDAIIEENNLEKAERLSYIFGLNLQQLLEGSGDLMIAHGSYHSGIILYKQSKVHLLKRVLKLAVSADCRTLLKFVHLCLSSSKVDMSMATKIHIGNLAVMAYTELILRFGGQTRISSTKDFMNFLRYEEFYDQVLAVNVACQASHWNIVSLLAKSRGLQPEVVSALGQILQTSRAPKPFDYDFLITLSEPSLIQSMMIFPQSGQEILSYIKTNIQHFPVEILKRLTIQLDPTQSTLISFTSKLYHIDNFLSSLDTTLDSFDSDDVDKEIVVIKDLIETFLIVLIYLTSKIDKLDFDLKFLEPIEQGTPPVVEKSPEKLPDLQHLSCGYEHAAIIRNGHLYTMGVSSAGCLGLGPLLTQSSPPRLVQTLYDLKLKILSVSCARKHTIALTDYGVYAWGSNRYGQLGLGRFIQETPYPQMITALISKKIIQITTGQYHSLALDSRGRVHTWGWGIHGQLGHGTSDNEYYPKLLDFNECVIQIAAGHAHSLVLTDTGKLYGFGSNVFGQLDNSQLESTSKSTRPIWIVVMPDIHTPIEKITTAYFHNVAVTDDQDVYTWGASPQEVRFVQSRQQQNQKQNGVVCKADTWKSTVHVYSGGERPIEKISVGYRHSAILHNGKIMWGRSKDDDLSPAKLKDEDLCIFNHRFIDVSCGLDYTMAIDRNGKLLAWGSPSMAQTILGKVYEEETRRNDTKIIVSKNTKRIIKYPTSIQTNNDNFPVEVPGLPRMAITFNPIDHSLIFARRIVPDEILSLENERPTYEDGRLRTPTPLEEIHRIPKVRCGQKTLHYALEKYHSFYDIDNILAKCLDANNHQAAAKVAMLDGHFSDSLGFQLTAFKNYMDKFVLDFGATYKDKDDVREKEQNYVELVIRNLQKEDSEKNSLGQDSKMNSPARILSSSSSLDSIRQWGDELENQGGCESPCRIVIENSEIKQNVTHYVQCLRSNELQTPIHTISQMVSCNGLKVKNGNDTFDSTIIEDENSRKIVEMAVKLVEFYIKKIYASENTILMQNVLLKCIEFWLDNGLPVAALECVLLKNMDKYFHALSILLFCKDLNTSGDEIIKKKDDQRNSASFLKKFSTKFCLQLCQMVLENVNKV